MNKMEKAALQHAKEELNYQRSKQAQIDLEIDKKRQTTIDRQLGHLPACTLTKCVPGCTNDLRHIVL